jgi:ubiquinone biosynthesis protein COQ4
MNTMKMTKATDMTTSTKLSTAPNNTATPARPHDVAPVMPHDIASLPAPVRWRRALRALVRVLTNPDETDQVLVFSSYINAGGSKHRLERFFTDPRGQKLYAERRAIDSHTVDLDALAALPAGTLGHAYATFMKSHGLTPNVFDGTPEEIADPRTAYVVQRMRQTHDLWHVVTNAETDPAGEVALQAFTYAQLGAPSSGILAALGTLRTLRHDRRILRDVRAMYKLGQSADRLPVFAWEDHWATPLAEVRRMLRLPEQPRPIGGYMRDVLEAARAELRAAA